MIVATVEGVGGAATHDLPEASSEDDAAVVPTKCVYQLKKFPISSRDDAAPPPSRCSNHAVDSKLCAKPKASSSAV